MRTSVVDVCDMSAGIWARAARRVAVWCEVVFRVYMSRFAFVGARRAASGSDPRAPCVACRGSLALESERGSIARGLFSRGWCAAAAPSSNMVFAVRVPVAMSKVVRGVIPHFSACKLCSRASRGGGAAAAPHAHRSRNAPRGDCSQLLASCV